MAEPAGLAISAVALASLFSTCVELVEYFELSRSFAYDYDKACLKLSLLRARLASWGKRSGMAGGSCHQAPNSLLRAPGDLAEIQQSLRGIANILQSAETLKHKYSLSLDKSRPSHTVFPRNVRLWLKSNERGQARLSGACSPAPGLWRSTSWAIRDKQKFDDFISDLSFFIANLEAIFPQDSGNCAAPADIASRGLGSNKVLAADPWPDPMNNSTSSSRRKQASLALAAPTGSPPYSPTANGNCASPGSRSWSSKGNEFYVETVDKKGATHQGSIDGGKLEQVPPGQTNSYSVGRVTDDGTVLQGGLSLQGLQSLLNRNPGAGSTQIQPADKIASRTSLVVRSAEGDKD